MIHPSPQFRSRARAPALLVLFGTAIWFAACADDPTGPRMRGLRAHFDPGMPTLAQQEWNPPKSCVIGWPAALQSFFPVAFPASDTVCGVRWTAWTPEFIQHRSEYALMFHEFVNYDTSHNKLFSVGTYGDIQNGPLQFTFDPPVESFSLYLWQIAMAGHAMSAYDSTGQLIDSVDFDAAPDTQSRTLDTTGIRTVYIYKPLTPPTPGVDRGVLDFVYHRAGFELAPCPPPSDSVLRDTTVRRHLRNLLDSSKVWGPPTGRIEHYASIYRNLLTDRYEVSYAVLEPNATPCTAHVIDYRALPAGTYRLMGVVHTHAFFGPGGAGPGETYPSNCPPAWAGGKAPEEWKPSDQDWRNARNPRFGPNGTIGYIVSKTFVTRFEANSPVGGDSTKRDSLTKHWKWNAPGCRWRGMRPPPA